MCLLKFSLSIHCRNSFVNVIYLKRVISSWNFLFKLMVTNKVIKLFTLSPSVLCSHGKCQPAGFDFIYILHTLGHSSLDHLKDIYLSPSILPFNSDIISLYMDVEFYKTRHTFDVVRNI